MPDGSTAAKRHGIDHCGRTGYLGADELDRRSLTDWRRSAVSERRVCEGVAWIGRAQELASGAESNPFERWNAEHKDGAA